MQRLRRNRRGRVVQNRYAIAVGRTPRRRTLGSVPTDDPGDALRIALFTDTYPPQINGVARTLARALTALTARGHDVRVFTTDDLRATRAPCEYRFAGRPFWAYPELRIARPNLRSVRRALGDWRPDLVHVATPFGIGLAGRRLALAERIPLVSSYHTSLAAYAKFYGLSVLTPLAWRFLRWFHNSGRLTLCPTDAIRRELVDKGFRNLSLWRRGIDAAQFHPDHRSRRVRASWGAAPSTTVIAYVGRLAAEKGIGDALAAMRRVVDTDADVVCVIAGVGPYELEARRLAPSGTIFTGRIEGRALSETFASADIFVFPSVTDTFGNVVQEALASGLAVVAADVPQTREVIPDQCQVLYRPGDVDSLTNTLLRLIAQPAETNRLRALGPAEMADRSWDAVFDRLERDYRVAASGSGRSSTRTSRGSSALSW